MNLKEMMNNHTVVVLNGYTGNGYQKNNTIREEALTTLTDMKQANAMLKELKDAGIPAALVKFPEGWGFHADLFVATCPLCTDSDAPVCNETVCQQCTHDATYA